MLSSVPRSASAEVPDIDVYDGEYRVDSSTLEVVVVVLSLALLEGKCGRAGSMVELITYDASDFYGMFFRG